jgi:cysteinyl-tRNA synthetase
MLSRLSSNTCAQVFRASLLSPVAALLLAGALLVGCDGGDDTAGGGICTDVAASYDATTGQAPSAGNLLYQLQNGVIAQIAASGFDVVVMDYSSDGSDAGAYSASDLDTLGAAGIVALAYFSIGEAESYRYYFDQSWIESSGELQPTASAPCWLGRTNPDWAGNYKVQHWSDAWQTILMAYLDRIVDAGFDGVYLDIIDGYEYWSDAENGEGFALAEAVAAERMINLVRRIGHHARITRGVSGFYVFPQNGEPILEYDGNGGFLQTVSGIGVEDVFYDETTAQSAAFTTFRLGYLEQFVGAGKLVLSTDYVDDGSGSGANTARIADFIAQAEAEGFLPYAALSDRALDEINTIPGVQPSP